MWCSLRLGRRGRAGRASPRLSPARGAPDAVPRSGAALDPNAPNSAVRRQVRRQVRPSCRITSSSFGGFWSLRSVIAMGRCAPFAWNGSWNGALDYPSAADAVSAMTYVICAASAYGARGRTSCKRQASGSNPLTGSQVRRGFGPAGARIDKCRLHHANTIDNVRKRPTDRAA